MLDLSPKHDVRVVAKERLNAHVVELRLASVDGGDLPFAEPGAHIEIFLPSGISRQYSLIPSPSRGEWRVAVLREGESRGGSVFIHEDSVVGDIVQVGEPRNQYRLAPADEYLFLAGGIGITPFLSMIEDAEKRGCEWNLVYTGREAHAMAYADELRQLHPNRVQIHISSKEGRASWGDVLDARPEADVYCCGPEGMIDTVTAVAAQSGRTVNVERFRADIQSQEGDEPFEIELAQSGMTLTVPPDRTALDVVEDAGVFVLFSCREGTCGTCETPVLSGEIDHRDVVLSPDEKATNTCMMLCVSRAARGTASITVDL